VERIGHRRRPSRALLLLCAVAAVAWLLAAVRVEAAPASTSELFHDSVIGGPVPTARTATASASSASGYPVAGGQTVQVEVDPAYAGTDALQRVLDTLGATVHGAEMSKLTVHIADATNLSRACGQNSTACYFPSSMTMVVSGDPINPNNQMPQGMVITHEYGHHIEANRSFPGWYATNLGGRHWATYEHVCEGVAAGTLFPGDQGVHYWENPGEAFAQAYATMLYPDAAPWWWSFAEPDEGAFDAIRADVADTSQGTMVRWGQRLNPRSPRASTSFGTSLDGPITVKVQQPQQARFQVALLSADGHVLTQGQAQRRWKGKKSKKAKGTSTSTLTYSSCGSASRSFQLQVTRIAGKGRFSAEIVRP
jgi:hypothetical protein